MPTILCQIVHRKSAMRTELFIMQTPYHSI